MQNFRQTIISSINQYGISCELKTSDKKTIKFKGILYKSKDNTHISQNEFLHAVPSETNTYTLIVADPHVLNYLTPGQTVKTLDLEYQILKCKKFILSDNLYYISSILSNN